MFNVDRSWRARVWDALLEFAWRDPYARWYLILVLAGYGLAAIYLPPWCMPLMMGWQLLVGWTADKLKEWNEAQADFDEQMRKER